MEVYMSDAGNDQEMKLQLRALNETLAESGRLNKLVELAAIDPGMQLPTCPVLCHVSCVVKMLMYYTLSREMCMHASSYATLWPSANKVSRMGLFLRLFLHFAVHASATTALYWAAPGCRLRRLSLSLPTGVDFSFLFFPCWY